MNNDQWESEFCGFTWGEGCLLVVTESRKGNIIFTARFRIILRADDAEILYYFQKRLGGYMYGPYSHPPSNPTMSWQVVGTEKLKRIRDILSRSVLPAKKRKELALWSEFLDGVPGIGKRRTTEQKERCFQIVNALREMRVYQQTGQAISA